VTARAACGRERVELPAHAPRPPPTPWSITTRCRPHPASKAERPRERRQQAPRVDDRLPSSAIEQLQERQVEVAERGRPATLFAPVE
jgi:hypothetical protein